MGFAPQSVPRPFLLRSPDHFRVAFEINPWMTSDVQPDPDRSWTQWNTLASALTEAGGTVLTAPSVPEWPDMVFPTDTVVASGGRFVTAQFSQPDRHGEARLAATWLADNGYTEVSWDGATDAFLEGGDVVAFGDRLIAGHGVRTTEAAHRVIGTAFGAQVVPMRLVDPRFYHLDMSVCPLDDRRAMVSPDAWDEASGRRLMDLIPEPLVVDGDEAMSFCVNSVVIGKTVVMPACPPRIGKQLEAWGFTPHVVDVSEFLKAGGGIRCMTLDLDLLGESARELAGSDTHG